ncbi:hypothetical protein FRC00_004595 [Tulasnella sp. 408]|nr:hypothetical protein FRC00_004595 [Tulasnella sp. 408]
MSSKASGASLNSAQPSDIEFLSDFFTKLSALLKGKWAGALPVSWRGLFTVKLVLSEILGEGNNTQQEPHQNWELDSDTEDETWVQDWGIQELLAWLTATSSASSESSLANITFPETAETDLPREPEECNRPNLIPSLPTELVYAIFESVCSPRSLALFSPLILSHVDSHFRSIALGMPSLWSTIDDLIPLEIAKLYLERSENLPLDIRIGSESGATQQDISRLNGFFLYLEPHAHRVKALKVVAMNLNILFHLERLVDYEFPFGGLERLEYGRCFGPYRGESDRPLWLHEPSSLRELHLWSCPLDRWINGFPTALRRFQLTALAVSFDVLMAALESSPGLSALVLDDCNLLGNGEKVVDAGSLIKLQFTRIDSGQIDRFAGLIRTPALAALSVVAKSDTSNVGSTNHHDFLVNLVRGSKEILSIEICDYDFAENEWSSIFEHLPSLTQLRVRASYSSDDDLRALTTADILPNLTSITLDNELRLTTRLVEQIARTHPKLESIALRGWDPSNVSPESITAISELVKTLFIETFRASPEEGCDEETESNSSDDSSTEGSWL